MHYCYTFTLVTEKKLIDHSKHLRELWFWGAEKNQPDEDTFHWVFQLENYISFPLGFYVHVSCISKSRNEWVCVCARLNCHWYSALCFIVLNALLVLKQTARCSSCKAHRFITITCGILNSYAKVLFISTHFQFHAASITPAPLRWQRLSHRPPNRELPLLKDDEWSVELQVKDDVWSPAADGSASVTAHQWRPWWTSGWKRALIKEPHAQQHASAAHPWSAVTAAGYNKIALRVIWVFGDVTTSTFHKCQSQMSLVGPALIFLRPISLPHLIALFPATHPGISGKFSI